MFNGKSWDLLKPYFAACWLKLCLYKVAKNHYDLVLKLDIWNVKAWFKRATACLNLCKMEEPRNDLLISRRFVLPMMKLRRN